MRQENKFSPCLLTKNSNNQQSPKTIYSNYHPTSHRNPLSQYDFDELNFERPRPPNRIRLQPIHIFKQKTIDYQPETKYFIQTNDFKDSELSNIRLTNAHILRRNLKRTTSV